MNKGIFQVSENKKLIEKLIEPIYQMTLKGDTSAILRPGQFLNIAIDNFYLRRPISVCDWNEESVVIVYKVVGEGTKYMSTLKAGQRLDVLSGLGNGYDLNIRAERPLLVGGGVGTPPIYCLAKRLVEQKIHPPVVLGFRTKADVFYAEKFEALGLKVILTTEDGSQGIKGFVTAGIKGYEPDYLFACGREEMLRAVYDECKCDGQYSFEERMACGFGACMGCSCETMFGYKRVCREGPIFKREEIMWKAKVEEC